jgi:hypothetical protein
VVQQLYQQHYLTPRFFFLLTQLRIMTAGKIHIASTNQNGTKVHMLKNSHQILSCNSVLIFGLFSIISLFYSSVYLPTQIYGSTDSSSAMDDTEQNNDKIPFILPDISSTDSDLNDVNDNDNAESDDDATSKDNSRDNRDTDEENGKEASDEDASDSGEDFDSGDSLLPFP